MGDITNLYSLETGNDVDELPEIMHRSFSWLTYQSNSLQPKQPNLRATNSSMCPDRDPKTAHCDD